MQMRRTLPLLTKASPQIEIGCHGTEPYHTAGRILEERLGRLKRHL